MGFYYVYILRRKKDKKFYIGHTTDLIRRLKDHNQGKNKSTRHRRPLQLIFFEAYISKQDALRREKYFKTTKGKVVLRQMLKEFLNPQGNK